LKQGQYVPMNVAHQVAILYAALNGFLDTVAVEDVAGFESGLHEYLDSRGQKWVEQVSDSKDLTPELENDLKTILTDYAQTR
jgi:F-type H+-transporting ATPase subunit alpha